MVKKVFTLLALLLVATVPLLAQSTTAGSVTGTVTDSSGGALPGVTVELSGAAMQGVRTAIADSQGNFRFANVPPGEAYTLKATLEGFAPASKTIARVYLGQEAKVDFALRAAVTESITVTAEAPLVDVSNTTTGVNVTARQFESLPTQRTFQQLTTLAPGVSMDMSNSRANAIGQTIANSPTVGASSAPENNYIIDGLSTTDARYGTSGTNLTMNFVEEVQVMTGGYSAEFGRSTGGVFNVITKSGSNQFRGDVFGYFADDSWVTDRVMRSQKGTNFGTDRTENMDFGLSLGGPIMRDRLWFFGAYNPSRRTTDVGAAQPLVGDPATTFEQETTFYAGKLTFAVTPNHNLVGTVFGDPTTQDGWLVLGLNAPAAEFDAATWTQDIGSNNYNLRYNGIMNQNWLVEANFGHHHRDSTQDPLTERGRSVPRQIDETVAGGFWRGGYPRFQQNDSGRDAYAIKFSNFLRSHELRYGIDIEDNQHGADLHETWYRWFGDRMQERNYAVLGEGDTKNEAIFLQDQWKLRPNLQFNLGLRMERQKMSSARGVFVASEADLSDQTLVDSITLGNDLAPRLGVVWDPMNNGRSKVYAYAGRFFEAIPLDMNIRALHGEDYIISTYRFVGGIADDSWYNPNGNPIPESVRNSPVAIVPPASGWYKSAATPLTAVTPVDRDLKTPYQDEMILGGEYQFGDVWSAGLRLVNRELKRVVEDFGTFADPNDPLLLTGYIIGNPGEGALGAPYEKPERTYRAAEFTVQRAFRDNWQMVASYTYARARGNYEGLFMTGYEQLDPNITALYDVPSFGNNAMGKLRADRPVNLKLHTSYRFPFGLTVSEGFYYTSGVPISATGPELYNGYGDGTINLLPRGSNGRADNIWSLDLHADWALPVFKNTGRTLSLIVDVFNVTDQSGALEVDQDYVYEALIDLGPQYAPWFDAANLDANGNVQFNPNFPASPYYGSPLLLQSPRSVQVGVKFAF
jgi:outer membrane receptor protein involved in Fe transport